MGKQTIGQKFRAFCLLLAFSISLGGFERAVHTGSNNTVCSGASKNAKHVRAQLSDFIFQAEFDDINGLKIGLLDYSDNFGDICEISPNECTITRFSGTL